MGQSEQSCIRIESSKLAYGFRDWRNRFDIELCDAGGSAGELSRNFAFIRDGRESDTGRYGRVIDRLGRYGFCIPDG